MQAFQHAVIGLVDHFGYVGLFIAMMLGNIGAPIGTEIVLPAAGALTARGHLPSVVLTIIVAVLGELAGGTLGYAIGRFGGRPFVEKYGKYVRFHHAYLDKIDAFFDRHGSVAIFVFRFVPVLRGVAAIPAGISRMHLAAFYLWTALGSALFCGGLVWVGFAFGEHLDALMPLIHRYAKLAVVLCVAIALLWGGIALARNRRAARAGL